MYFLSCMVYVDARQEMLENEDTPLPSERASLVEHGPPAPTTYQAIHAPPPREQSGENTSREGWFSRLLRGRKRRDYEAVSTGD